MKWVTRKGIRVNRTATAWLIRRFIDPQAEFHFREPDDVARFEREHGAIGFDAPSTRYAHDHGVTSFEQIIAEHRLTHPALARLARIVHAADVPGALHEAAEAAGLQAISRGFPLVAQDDHETVARASFLYDALYAALETERGAG